MNFIRGGHKDGVLTHHRPPEMKSDLITCEDRVDEERAVACPIKKGAVTFHHSATPHMTRGNSTKAWRKALAQHFRDPEALPTVEGDYPWRVYEDQDAAVGRTNPHLKKPS